VTDLSIDQLWDDLHRLLEEHGITLDEFKRLGEAGELGELPLLEYAYKAIWPVLEETTLVG